MNINGSNELLFDRKPKFHLKISQFFAFYLLITVHFIVQLRDVRHVDFRQNLRTLSCHFSNNNNFSFSPPLKFTCYFDINSRITYMKRYVLFLIVSFNSFNTNWNFFIHEMDICTIPLCLSSHALL